MPHSDGRSANQLRPISFEMGFSKWAEGSVLAKFGDTHVLCTATVDNRVPRWLHQSEKPHGWVTAEYGMLPRSTQHRMQREQKWPRGRTQEIERLIGRSLRMSVDLRRLGVRQVIIDCDVLQADGGTRTAAITGSWLALKMALQPLIAEGKISEKTLTFPVAAISVGIVEGEPLLDLAYAEDSRADVDLNVVMATNGRLIEVQGTGEKNTFSREQLNTLMTLAEKGINELFEHQQAALETLK